MKYIRQYFEYKNLHAQFMDRDYAEVPYRDHFEDGTEATGSEDFNYARFRSQTEKRFIYRKTSKFDRGGHSLWECIGCVRCRNAVECGKLARAMYPEETISIRQY